MATTSARPHLIEDTEEELDEVGAAPGPAAAVDRMRVALVAPVWLPIPPPAYGGVEWIVHELATGLSARGHEVTLVATGGSSAPASHRVQPYDTPPIGRIGEILPELVHAVSAYSRLGDHDVVHDHTLAGPVVASRSGIRVLHTVHGPLEPDLVRLLQQLDGVDLVAISDHQRCTRPDLAWLATVHNAIDVSSFPYRAVKDGYLCTMARMCPDKGIAEAIRLARMLGMPLRIAAKCHERAEREYFETRVKPLLGAGVEYVGELGTDEKKELLAGATALAFPIQWDEPFGLAIIEALACGTPVIATARGSVPELVRHGVTGVVADSVVSLAHRSMELLGSLDSRECRADAERRFDVARLVRDYERLYDIVAGRSRVP